MKECSIVGDQIEFIGDHKHAGEKAEIVSFGISVA